MSDDDQEQEEPKRTFKELLKGKTPLKELLKNKTSWMTQTKAFQRAVDWAFETVDADKSGEVNLEELYSGLLLIHLQFAAYVGAPACRPASKEYVTEIFRLLDINNSGSLCKEEFTLIMKILYSQVFSRILIQWALTLMIVPVLSKYIIILSKATYTIAHDFWKDVDDDLDPIQRILWKLWFAFLDITPEWLDNIGLLLWEVLCKAPETVWSSLPMTLLTLVQTSLAVPWVLMKVESFFWHAAKKKENEAKTKPE